MGVYLFIYFQTAHAKKITYIFFGCLFSLVTGELAHDGCGWPAKQKASHDLHLQTI